MLIHIRRLWIERISCIHWNLPINHFLYLRKWLINVKPNFLGWKSPNWISYCCITITITIIAITIITIIIIIYFSPNKKVGDSTSTRCKNYILLFNKIIVSHNLGLCLIIYSYYNIIFTKCDASYILKKKKSNLKNFI